MSRTRNEDAFAISSSPDFDVILVCDGVSSAQLADEASQLAATVGCRSAVRLLAESAPGGRASGGAAAAGPRGTGPRGADRRATGAVVLREALLEAQGVVCQLPFSIAAQTDPPETTVVTLLRQGRTMDIAWLGDSRAYLVTPTTAHVLTRDHSWANVMIDSGLLTFEEAVNSAEAHCITKTLGGLADNASEWQEPSYTRVELEPGPALLVLCTDGLWNYLAADAQLVEILKDEWADLRAMSVVRTLIDYALRRGGHDNVTVAVLAFPD